MEKLLAPWTFANIYNNNNISDNISYYVCSTTVLRTLQTLSHSFLHDLENGINRSYLCISKTRLERTAYTWQRKE